MADFSADDLDAARPRIASLISKSEKAQLKLAPDSWQHKMLAENLCALRVASALLEGKPSDPNLTASDLQAALDAIDSMADRTETAMAKFAAGTSQHSLLHNRLAALRLARALVIAEAEQR